MIPEWLYCFVCHRRFKAAKTVVCPDCGYRICPDNHCYCTLDLKSRAAVNAMQKTYKPCLATIRGKIRPSQPSGVGARGTLFFSLALWDGKVDGHKVAISAGGETLIIKIDETYIDYSFPEIVSDAICLAKRKGRK